MKEQAHGKRKHALFAPSSSKRWLTCAASIELCKRAPTPRVHPSADEGTSAHECLEFIVKRYGNLDRAAAQAASYLKKDERTKSYGLAWNEEMIRHAVRSAKVIMQLRPSKSAELLIEQRVRLSPDVFGSLDYAWAEDWGRLIVIDYKYGKHLVLPYDEEEKEENTQLMCYGTALAKKFNYEFDAVELAIIQPRVWEEDEEPIAKHPTSVKKLRSFEQRVKEAVAAAKAPGEKEFVTGEHCTFCPAKSICPAQGNAEHFDYE